MVPQQLELWTVSSEKATSPPLAISARKSCLPRPPPSPQLNVEWNKAMIYIFIN